MNRNRLEKSMALVLVGAVTMGFTGCLDFGGANKQAVVDAADEMASYMLELNADKLIKNSTLDKKSKEADKLSVLFSNDGRSDEDIMFFNAVEGTIDYEIDVESLEIKKNEASIDIVFEIADYSSVLKDEFTKIDDLVSAVQKAKTKEITFTAEFVKEEKEWIADSVASKKFMQIYDYRNEEIELALTPEMIAALIDRKTSSFWLTTDGKYVDTDLFEYDYYFAAEILDYSTRGVSLFYIIEKDGSEIYRSEYVTLGESTNVCCDLEASELGLLTFEAGNYTVKLFMSGSNGEELIDEQSIAVEEPVATPTPVPGNNGEGSADFFRVMDSSFAQKIQKYGWFNAQQGYIYKTDSDELFFSLLVDPSFSDSLDFEYCYCNSADQASLTDAINNPVYSGTATPQDYDNGRFIDFVYDFEGEAEIGFYFILIYEAGTENVLAYAFCIVT